ncbi:desmethyl-deoxy-podophyllotoxin synthase-like [Cornus florida]|uniref:desmethyl-deoxy-podophyllotoxin synthase-like n=1 Tax=Cornus florida TaxID=4283 RepID=UPI002899F7AC|nr:desmethyl-deoxy-podophyllotoxin synthase-like [Cornus florida]
MWFGEVSLCPHSSVFSQVAEQLVLSITAKATIGKKFQGQEEFISLIKEAVVVAGGFKVADLFPSVKMLAFITGLRLRLEKLHQNLIGYLPTSLMTIKLGRWKHRPMMDMFSGGIETSFTTIIWAMSELLKNLRVMEKVQAKSRERCEINGYEIPAKSQVIVNIWAISRDPKNWTDLESFLLERFLDSLIDYKGTDFQYLPFGAGRRICPGVSFGVANVELPLVNLLYHFDWKLPEG